ncbi:hypothetical protein [Roseomonas sp. CECT 9278]|uniref:hypothetical protein n=1 Tax=Roseomonas sp. CECT 9278 TaxID=2845823 RepID=UPI001E5E37BC|nr:hypothetical protein [Roseomonas sp. CECT 9278]CAH0281949.1 hypothetical protein ROS9278_03968 [Roseomonas sp. CECT 9278]
MRALRRALLDGALVVLPLGAVVLLVLGIIHKLQDAADPLARSYGHPAIAAVLLLVLLCLVIGLLVRSAAGGWARRVLEGALFDRIPGYRLVKAFSGEGPLARGGGRALRPALAAIEEGWCPALVMDGFADGRLVVFVPGSPAPMSGALYVFAPERVRYLDVPLLPFLKAISSWGLGLREMIETQEARQGDGGAG